MKKWDDDDDIIKQMIQASNGTLWGNKLEQSNHYPILKKCLEFIGNDGLLIDLGCGAGDVSRTWEGNYLGVDLPWVIEKVAKVCNVAQYISADLTQEIPVLPKAKCILMNAFLDVQKNPHEILSNVIDKIEAEWIIVHRQKIGKIDDFMLEKSYGDSFIPISTMSYKTIESFSSVVEIVEIVPWENNYYSIVMKKL
jgi:hypothetical protein